MAKRRKTRGQKGEGENREKQEEIKKETRENPSSRLFQGISLLALLFLAILKTSLWFLKALIWWLMIVLHAIISYDKVYEGLRHDNHDYGMK